MIIIKENKLHNNALEPPNPRRGASGAVWRGSRKQPLASSPPSANRTPNLARRLENLTAFDFQCCERPLGSTHLPPPLLRKPVRVRGSARRYMGEENPIISLNRRLKNQRNQNETSAAENTVTPRSFSRGKVERKPSYGSISAQISKPLSNKFWYK